MIGSRSRSLGCLGVLARQQAGGLDEVVSKHPKSAPQLGAREAVQQGSGPAEVVLELADAAFAAGAPLDQPTKGSRPLDRLASGAGAASAGNGDPGHTEFGYLPVYPGLAVATVGGDRPWRRAGLGDDPPDGGGQQGASGGLPTMTV